MRAIVRSGAAAVLAIALASPAFAQGGNDAKKAAEPPKIDLNEILATVDGDKITRGEAIAYANQETQGQPPPQDRQKEAYDYFMNALVNVRLLRQFLDEKKVTVPKADVDAELNRIVERVKSQGGSNLPAFLEQIRLKESGLRTQILDALRWKKYFTGRARANNGAELNDYKKKNRDYYEQNQVRASHILLLVPSDATEAEKAKIKKRLLDIKADIDAGKISFEDAANKYSEDPKVQADQDGGDLGFFYRKQMPDEAFSAAAFALPIDKVSDPVEGNWGYELILVKARNTGRPLDPNQYKEVILNQFGVDLQREILTAERERKKSRINIRPMPSDFFAPNPTPPAAPAGDAKAEKKG
ncbi:MAG TPA: peptidylprolyl isomerase [Isosphaeraceae bacterium]|jgi:peptidyl-prolyl cis-trans isomerase C|nr:peptidylprolyl isomerase [Isosphaeraceae bacterium]